MKIEKLTPQQIDKMAEYRDKWIAIGLSTEPANRPKAEAAIIKAYAAANLSAPRIVWCGSPLSQGLTRAIILNKKLLHKAVRDSVGASVWASVRDSVRASVGDSVWASVGDSVRDSVRDSVGASVRDSVRDSVWASVWASVGDSVRASVGDSVRASVRASVGASVGASVRDSVRASVWASVRASVGASVLDSVRASVGDSVYGQHEASWLAFYEYFRDVCGLAEQTDKLIGLTEYAKHAGWFLPHEKICWASERHHILNRDDRGRLHNIEGPAVGYPDGFSVYAVHGIRVPEWIVTKKNTISPEKIDAESNAEVRRVMLEFFGLDRYLLTGNVIAHEGEYRLIQKTMPNGPQMVSLTMRCPTTGAVYVHPVHPNVTTIDQALAWKRGIDDFNNAKPYKEVIQWER